MTVDFGGNQEVKQSVLYLRYLRVLSLYLFLCRTHLDRSPDVQLEQSKNLRFKERQVLKSTRWIHRRNLNGE